MKTTDRLVARARKEGRVWLVAVGITVVWWVVHTWVI